MVAAAKLEIAVSDDFATVRGWRRMRAAGFSLTVDGSGLVVTPASGLTDSQRAYIRDHKAALLALLADAEALASALDRSGLDGLGWREGTPSDWSDTRLLAAGELLYADGRMVSALGRRYAAVCAPVVELGPEYTPSDCVPEIEPQAEEAA